MSNYLGLILGMMVVTFIPRLLPFIFMSKLKLPISLYRFLRLIPYTALGALIIPGVINAIPGQPLASILGALFAILYAWHRGGMIVAITGSILISFLYITITI